MSGSFVGWLGSSLSVSSNCSSTAGDWTIGSLTKWMGATANALVYLSIVDFICIPRLSHLFFSYFHVFSFHLSLYFSSLLLPLSSSLLPFLSFLVFLLFSAVFRSFSSLFSFWVYSVLFPIYGIVFIIYDVDLSFIEIILSPYLVGFDGIYIQTCSFREKR